MLTHVLSLLERPVRTNDSWKLLVEPITGNLSLNDVLASFRMFVETAASVRSFFVDWSWKSNSTRCVDWAKSKWKLRRPGREFKVADRWSEGIKAVVGESIRTVAISVYPANRQKFIDWLGKRHDEESRADVEGIYC